MLIDPKKLNTKWIGPQKRSFRREVQHTQKMLQAALNDDDARRAAAAANQWLMLVRRLEVLERLQAMVNVRGSNDVDELIKHFGLGVGGCVDLYDAYKYVAEMLQLYKGAASMKEKEESCSSQSS